MLPSDFLAATLDRKPAAERLLEALVNEPSGSRHANGVARVLDRLGGELAELGFAVERIPPGAPGAAPHLVAWIGGQLGTGDWKLETGNSQLPVPSSQFPVSPPRVLLIGHADTVFPPSDPRRFAVDGEMIRGPGCADMKGGLVVALEALRALGPGLRAARGALEVIVNGDEELGSPGSRDLILERAKGARAALVFENCDEEDALIVGRKGLGRATIRIRGRAAHAGIAPEKGVSAVLEMAHEILAVSALDAPERGLGVVVGIARGGLSRNTVPPEAEIEVDLRCREKADGERALAAIRAIAARPTIPGTSAEVEGELHRPPMAPETAPGDLLERARRAARALGLRGGAALRAIATGGGSDANLTADLGVPTLDGMGVVGGDIHTLDEWCLRRSIPERAALAATLLQELLEVPQ